jgi:hypothetical protein
VKYIEKQYDDYYSKIAFNWVSILYHHINLENPLGDMLCTVDFDGNWNTSNNRRHLYTNFYDLIPVV